MVFNTIYVTFYTTLFFAVVMMDAIVICLQDGVICSACVDYLGFVTFSCAFVLLIWTSGIAKV